jgi:hypothetical protein
MPRLSTLGENGAAQGAITPGVSYNLSLHNGDTGTTGASEITGYTRQSIVFASAVAGTMLSTTQQLFTGLPVLSGVGWIGVWDGSGNFVAGGVIGDTITQAANIPVTFAIGAIYIEVS